MRRDYVQSAAVDAATLKDEYVGTVYGSAALGCITSLYCSDMEDALRLRCPDIVRGRVKGLLGRLDKAFAMMRQNIAQCFLDGKGAYWAADFGLAVYELVQPPALRLQTAVANHLGRYRGVPDINACAMVIVAQSMASEAALYVERRQRRFRGCTAVTSRGRQSVPFLLGLLSMRGVCHTLELLVEETVGRCLPDDADLLADPQVKTGCGSVLNILGSVDTWTYARDKADRLNGGVEGKTEKHVE